jgi:CubicO group peptidase (beta-lactamase class C family)
MVPDVAGEIAAGAIAELGLPGIVLAGGGPDTPAWAAALGWADLDRAEPLTVGHRFPACTITQLITATAILRLVADGRIGLDDPASAHLRASGLAQDTVTVRELLTHSSDAGYAALGQLIADVTRMSYPTAAACLVLGPLGMRDSSFQGDRPGCDSPAVTRYRLSPEMTFAPAPAAVSTMLASRGMWTTAADLLRFGTRWTSLLPEALAREAVRPQAARGRGGVRMGLGWPVGADGDIIGISGGGPGAFASLLVRLGSAQRSCAAHVVLTNRRLPIQAINVRLLRASAARAPSQT